MGLWGFPFGDNVPNVRSDPYSESPLDRVICRRVAERLLAEPPLISRGIDITVHNGVVILAGVVADGDSRKIVSEIAWDTPEVFDVSNRLVVE